MRPLLGALLLALGCSAPKFSVAEHDAGSDGGAALADIRPDAAVEAGTVARARLQLDRGGFLTGGVSKQGSLVVTEQGFEGGGRVCAGTLCAQGGLTP
jgi:hypothetical protein